MHGKCARIVGDTSYNTSQCSSVYYFLPGYSWSSGDFVSKGKFEPLAELRQHGPLHELAGLNSRGSVPASCISKEQNNRALGPT